MIIQYDKLVRDLIPVIIEGQGKEVIIEKIESKEKFLDYLKKKLKEEVDEYLENPCVEELVDIQTVVNNILKISGISSNEFLEAYNKKLISRGDFSKRIILKSVKE